MAMAMAMPFQPFFLNTRTRVGDLQVLSASKRPKYPDAFVKIFFNPKITFVNLFGYLPKSRVHQFESIAKNLTPVGLERIVVHVHWGAVERDGQQYHWAGCQELLFLARSFGLKVKVVFGFHHHYYEGIEVGAKSVDYISFGCDDLPLLEGRSPTDVYSDFMKSFVNTFSSLLGHTITDIEIGLGPNGEFRFPYFMNRGSDSMSIAKSDFVCFDKHMLKGTFTACLTPGLAEEDGSSRFWDFSACSEGGFCSWGADDSSYFLEAMVRGRWLVFSRWVCSFSLPCVSIVDLSANYLLESLCGVLCKSKMYRWATFCIPSSGFWDFSACSEGGFCSWGADDSSYFLEAMVRGRWLVFSRWVCSFSLPCVSIVDLSVNCLLESLCGVLCKSKMYRWATFCIPRSSINITYVDRCSRYCC